MQRMIGTVIHDQDQQHSRVLGAFYSDSEANTNPSIQPTNHLSNLPITD